MLLSRVAAPFADRAARGSSEKYHAAVVAERERIEAAQLDCSY